MRKNAMIVFLAIDYLSQDDYFSFIHLPANIIISFFLIIEQYSIVFLYRIFVTHSSVHGHLVCF